MTRRYKSFKSDAATCPASNVTNGRISGGITGITSGNIHAGSVLESKNASTNFNCLIKPLRFESDFVSANSARKRVRSSPISKLAMILRTPSAPIPTWKESAPNSSTAFWYSSSLITSYCFRLVKPGSMTMYASYEITCSNFFCGRLFNNVAILPSRKNQVCATGIANFMCPIRSRRTVEEPTSTPQRSQTTPRNLILLYLPQAHS